MKSVGLILHVTQPVMIGQTNMLVLPPYSQPEIHSLDAFVLGVLKDSVLYHGY